MASFRVWTSKAAASVSLTAEVRMWSLQPCANSLSGLAPPRSARWQLFPFSPYLTSVVRHDDIGIPVLVCVDEAYQLDQGEFSR